MLRLKKLEIPCNYCEEIFKSSSSASIHYKNCHPNLPIVFDGGHSKYSCHVCDDFFFDEEELIQHSRRKHGVNKTKYDNKKHLIIQCDYCNEELRGSKRVKSHYRIWHHNQPIIAEGHKRYNCDKCSEFFFVQDELECHLNLDHGVKTEKKYCDRCNRSYKDTHDCYWIKKDMKLVPSQKKVPKIHPCSQCEKTFTLKVNLRSHVKSEHDKCFDFECIHCGKKFASSKTLKNHIWQSHSPVTCEMCQKTVATSTELRKHKVFVHNKTEGAWVCEKCPKTVFFLISAFEKHVKDKH